MSTETQQTDVAKRVEDVLAALETLEVATPEQEQQAADFLRKIKQTEKIVTEQYEPKKKELYAPYKELLNEIKGYTDKLARAEKATRRAINAYIAEREKQRRKAEEKARREEEERRLNAAVDSGREEILDQPTVTQKEPEPERPENTYTVTRWKWMVVDKARVNPDYLTVDEKAVNAIVRAKKDDAAGILGDGIKVYSVQEVAVKT